MEEFKGAVRPLITLLFTVGFIYLAIVKIISAEAFIGLATLVIKHWFDTREHKANGPAK